MDKGNCFKQKTTRRVAGLGVLSLLGLLPGVVNGMLRMVVDPGSINGVNVGISMGLGRVAANA